MTRDNGKLQMGHATSEKIYDSKKKENKMYGRGLKLTKEFSLNVVGDFLRYKVRDRLIVIEF